MIDAKTARKEANENNLLIFMNEIKKAIKNGSTATRVEIKPSENTEKVLKGKGFKIESIAGSQLTRITW